MLCENGHQFKLDPDRPSAFVAQVNHRGEEETAESSAVQEAYLSPVVVCAALMW